MRYILISVFFDKYKDQKINSYFKYKYFRKLYISLVSL